LRDASHLWGKLIGEAEDLIKAELADSKVEVMLIGPAGEKLARLAAIINMRNRANGRTGMGAVMGSKNLKAVVVKNTEKITAADKAAITRMQRSGTNSIDAYPDVKGVGLNGTADVVVFQNSIGSFPTRNYAMGQFDGFETLAGDHMSQTILKERDTCYACTVRCKRVVETEYLNRKVQPEYGGPEYETIGTFGSYCLISDLKPIALANQICNSYGLDTIGTGASIAFAMECFENGLLTASDTDGLDLRFGNAEAMLALVEKIGRREGFGDRLADGSARLAEQLGPAAAEYLVTVKKTELPAHMPQAKKSLGVIYAVNPFGADHQSSEHDPMYQEGGFPYYYERLALLGLDQVQPAGAMNAEMVRFAYLTELLYSAMDTYCLCQFVWGPSWQLYGPQEMADMLSAASGWEISIEEILKVGERRLNLMRAFNAREGFTRADDILPRRFIKPLTGAGPTAGVALDPADLEHYKDIYYSLAGWDVKSGNPSVEKLDSLSLGWLIS
jgi:aldehyde:ferredoxin oxidoreductase